MTRTIPAIAAALMLGGCVIAVDRSRGDDPAPTAAPAGPVGERRFEVARFDAVELAGSDNVRVLPGDAVSVVAVGEERALDALDIAVRGTTLHVGRREGRWRDRGAVVTVTVPSLRAAVVRGSGGITVQRLAVPAFDGAVSGSGSLILEDAALGQASLSVGGSGSVLAAGRTTRLAADVGGSGSIDTRRMTALDATVGVGGSGSVQAVASRTATVTVGGSGSATVTGGASCTVSSGGSGSARCR